MLTYPVDPSYSLIELADLDRDPLPEAARAHQASLRAVVTWAREYLCRPHPDLGRTGNVCPYAQTALDRGTFYLTVQPGADPDLVAVASRLAVYRDWFRLLADQAGSSRMYCTILMVLPELPPGRASAVVDHLQDQLKGEYVAQGLMIGEFHDGPPDKGGLWNPDLRPLHSPVPILAIRHMVPTDYLFLESDPAQVSTYLRLYRDQVPAHLRRRVFGTVS
ncbi:DUF6875 domain-containing protein [Micromonospora sp. NBC_01813]|uniref:DUF6875 domain-containing protein n=1 Tax=Micromonospora sp. NBC_01813 TaxID=2975988 RepID=UPI002DD7AFB9|nr:hypothetical protein [Micromonospora sp. NBC_01813]WSA10204.1 hypothetical protein OG958_05250 [Micromonospora sp. NBC_01813]